MKPRIYQVPRIIPGARPLVDLGGIPPADYARATELRGTLRRFAEFCDKHEHQRIAKAFQPHEISDLRGNYETVIVWLDRFIDYLPGGAQ